MNIYHNYTEEWFSSHENPFWDILVFVLTAIYGKVLVFFVFFLNMIEF